MSERLDIPLATNPDATHCFQACIKMMLESQDPDTTYSWQELDAISAKVEGLWTWPIATWLWLQRHGHEVSVINTFDYDRFAKEGAAYLVEYSNEETAAAQVKNSDIAQERRLAAQLAQQVAVECRMPTFRDLRQALGRRSLACCNVNSNRLNGLPGYMGHFVVVTGCDKNNLYVNDPGGASRQGEKDRPVAYQTFAAAWGDPTPESRDVFMIQTSNI